jgi:hypothetical protein
MGSECSTRGEKRNALGILLGKSEGRIPLRRTRRRWKYIMKMDFREMGWGYMDWTNLA